MQALLAPAWAAVDEFEYARTKALCEELQEPPRTPDAGSNAAEEGAEEGTEEGCLDTPPPRLRVGDKSITKELDLADSLLADSPSADWLFADSLFES